jgi:hypothetical protein
MPIGAIIAGASALAGTAVNAVQNRRERKRQQKIHEENKALQRAELFQNSPAIKSQRLKDSGFNPNLASASELATDASVSPLASPSSDTSSTGSALAGGGASVANALNTSKQLDTQKELADLEKQKQDLQVQKFLQDCQVSDAFVSHLIDKNGGKFLHSVNGIDTELTKENGELFAYIPVKDGTEQFSKYQQVNGKYKVPFVDYKTTPKFELDFSAYARNLQEFGNIAKTTAEVENIVLQNNTIQTNLNYLPQMLSQQVRLGEQSIFKNEEELKTFGKQLEANLRNTIKDGKLKDSALLTAMFERENLSSLTAKNKADADILKANLIYSEYRYKLETSGLDPDNPNDRYIVSQMLDGFLKHEDLGSRRSEIKYLRQQLEKGQLTEEEWRETNHYLNAAVKVVDVLKGSSDAITNLFPPTKAVRMLKGKK